MYLASITVLFKTYKAQLCQHLVICPNRPLKIIKRLPIPPPKLSSVSKTLSQNLTHLIYLLKSCLTSISDLCIERLLAHFTSDSILPNLTRIIVSTEKDLHPRTQSLSDALLSELSVHYVSPKHRLKLEDWAFRSYPGLASIYFWTIAWCWPCNISTMCIL